MTLNKVDREAVPEMPNRLGIAGIEFIEYATSRPQALGQVLENMGFRPVARHRSREVTLYRQGSMNLVVNASPDDARVSSTVDGQPVISAVAFRVQEHLGLPRLLVDRRVEPHGLVQRLVGDGRALCADCDDTNPALGNRPPIVVGMVFAEDKVTLSWYDISPPPGAVWTYDVVRGLLSEFPVVGGGDGECLIASVPELSTQDVEEPAPGVGFWYLVRTVRNGCASTYGSATNGVVRYSAACGP